MKKKLTLHRDTLLNLDAADSVQGGDITLTFNCPTLLSCPICQSLVATCAVTCTISIQPTKFAC